MLSAANFSPVTVLDYEPNNKTAKDFYPQLLAKVNAQNSSSSDENCNYTSSLEFIENEILDNDMDNISQSSSVTSSSSISSHEDVSDLNSNSDRRDLINSLSHSSSRSSNLSKSDQLPESMSSTSSHRENTSNSFSFTSLLLDESEDLNNNEPLAPFNNNEPPPVVEPMQSPSSVEPTASPSSPFTSKIMQMFKGKWDSGSPSKHN